jgi:hypothetical protein
MRRVTHLDGSLIEMLSEKPFKFAHKKGEPLSKARIAIQENTEQLLLERQLLTMRRVTHLDGSLIYMLSEKPFKGIVSRDGVSTKTIDE